MIDHISVAVRDLKKAEAFYAAVLAALGLTKLRERPDATVGFGKKYPEFWINRRDAMSRVAEDSGAYLPARARYRRRRRLPRRGAQGRRHVGRRARTTAGILRALLRGVYSRSGRQSR